MCNIRKMSLGMSMALHSSFSSLLLQCSMIAKTEIGNKGHSWPSKKIKVSFTLRVLWGAITALDHQMLDFSLERVINFYLIHVAVILCFCCLQQK